MQSQVALRNGAKDDKNKDVIAKVCVIDAIIKVMRDHYVTIIWPYTRRYVGRCGQLSLTPGTNARWLKQE